MLAVSGGPDSRSLLEAFARWPGRLSACGAAVVVVSVDHQRQTVSAAAAAAVGLRAQSLGLPHEVVVVSPPAGDEQTLRRARYAGLAEVAHRRSMGVVVTAHQRGDVAEGLLLHLAGQGGGRGGRAPDVVMPLSAGVSIVRPFLALSRATLQAALDALGIDDVVVDEDDAAGKNARAAIRLHILAPLQGKRADVETALARHARHRAYDDALIEPLIPTSSVVDASLAPALLRRWLLRQVALHVDDPRTAPAALDDVLRLCALGRPGRVDLRGSHAKIWRERGRGLVVAVIAAAGQSE